MSEVFKEDGQNEELKNEAKLKFEEIKAFNDVQKAEKENKIIEDIINGKYKGYREYE